MFGAGLAIRPDIQLQRVGSQGFSLKLLPMDVADAQGLGTCGTEQWGMFSNDIKERTLLTTKHLEPCRVRMKEM